MNRENVILGINAYHGDVSAVLVGDGELLAAVEEERFRRVKHWAGFPEQAIAACLDIAEVSPEAITHIALSRDPRAHRLRKVLFALRRRPRWGLVRDRYRNRRHVQGIGEQLARTLSREPSWVTERLQWIEHHPAHLASAFYVSPFDEAAVCAIDGFGDFVSTSLAVGRGRELQVLDRVFFPHSLGLLYLAVTQFLGFHRYGDEYKVMGLAPYGRADYVKEMWRLIKPTRGGRFELDLSYFRHWSEGVAMTWEEGEPTMEPVYTEELVKLLGPAREPEEPVETRHEAIAASLQAVFEEVVFHVLEGLHRRTGLSRLCLAGGCAMNSVANGKIRARTRFEDVFVQPAAGDNGTALGAAYAVWHRLAGGSRRFVMEHAYWGPEFMDVALEKALIGRKSELDDRGCRLVSFRDEGELSRATAAKIAEGNVVGWFQGRMEWGARALGNRSIVADPRRQDMREIINSKIKFREKFRPFAPSILEEAVGEYFLGAVKDPFMIQVYPVRPEKRGTIPAVTHVDGSGRLQTVSERSNPRYYRLLEAFGDLTGVPVLLNTSFNENEPIVHTPNEAIDCFLRTDMDVLVLGRYVLEKHQSRTASCLEDRRARSLPTAPPLMGTKKT